MSSASLESVAGQPALSKASHTSVVVQSIPKIQFKINGYRFHLFFLQRSCAAAPALLHHVLVVFFSVASRTICFSSCGITTAVCCFEFCFLFSFVDRIFHNITACLPPSPPPSHPNVLPPLFVRCPCRSENGHDRARSNSPLQLPATGNSVTVGASPYSEPVEPKATKGTWRYNRNVCFQNSFLNHLFVFFRALFLVPFFRLFVFVLYSPFFSKHE